MAQRNFAVIQNLSLSFHKVSELHRHPCIQSTTL